MEFMVTKPRQTVTFVLVFLTCLLCFSALALGGEIPEIRVQLQANVNLAQVTIVAGQYDVVDLATGMPIGTAKEGDVISIAKEGMTLNLAGITGRNIGSHAGSVSLESKDKEYGLFSFNNVTYRGSLNIHNTDKGMVVVNILPLEAYLYGVVGPEIGYGAPEEALKSQAVASRSYAIKRLGSGLYSDLTLWSQVYKGFDAELVAGFDKVKNAIDATEGEVATYEDAIIDAVFHSNSGGSTECSENVWLSSVPYLKAVASPADACVQTFSYQDASGWPANCYQWSVTLTRDQLNKCIADWNAARPGDVINIGEITDIKLSKVDTATGKKTASGRVTAMTLVGTLGEKVITKDTIRSFFKVDGTILRSTLFDIVFNNDSSGSYGGKLVASSGTVPYNAYFDSITINGRGNGHGLGLSQWGARGMAADQGANYEDIILHYYSGVEIKDLY